VFNKTANNLKQIYLFEAGRAIKLSTAEDIYSEMEAADKEWIRKVRIKLSVSQETTAVEMTNNCWVEFVDKAYIQGADGNAVLEITVAIAKVGNI
jgi:hypothetical protein